MKTQLLLCSRALEDTEVTLLQNATNELLLEREEGALHDDN